MVLLASDVHWGEVFRGLIPFVAIMWIGSRIASKSHWLIGTIILLLSLAIGVVAFFVTGLIFPTPNRKY